MSDLPMIGWRRLFPALVLISVWTALTFLRVPEAKSFVWACVLAQVALIWRILPTTVRRQREVTKDFKTNMRVVLTVWLSVLAVQICFLNPLISHRVVSIYCGLYIILMVCGATGDAIFLDRFAPAAKDSKISIAFRKNILKLQAFVAFLALVVNETLVKIEAPLGARIAAFSLLPIFLYYFFAIALRLTYPPLEEEE
ncbi:hypothetical protein [Ruegeria lacuscaerulensis]|uniref:hypothetical protein n=1 Tax=Ruegeria lacuscaerulensis TaxID=55218 RepID=UPI00147B3A98|nr:hypothetical protein [Ruegeria lacuscaerulensis]